MRAYYFGCTGRVGHHHWNPDLTMSRDAVKASPWAYSIDNCGGHPGGTRGPEGHAVVLHKGGWSALRFNDRSVDGRPGAVSAFLFDEPALDFDLLVARAREAFPSVWERYGFEVVPA